MTTSPWAGFTELEQSETIPAPVVVEMGRRIEPGANLFIVQDKDENDPPGTVTDGHGYIIAATASGDWTGEEGNIAVAIGEDASNGWYIRTVSEGVFAYVRDENALYRYNGASWDLFASGSGPSATQTGEQISGFIATPADKSYKIVVKMAHGGTITETTTISASGTCTATFKVNSTALGGTANSVSSAEESQAHASTNTFSAGDDIVLTVSSNSSCADMSFTIKYTRTLA